MEVTREWAWGGSTGEGVRVGIIDSGIETAHPTVGGRVKAWAAPSLDKDEKIVWDFQPHEDNFGHGTACADIVRRIAPDVELTSIQVLGPGLRGKGPVFAAGLEWAINQRLDVINLSLGSSLREMAEVFHRIADKAYFANVILVTAANNMPVESYPSLYASVISVASHESKDPYEFYYNPTPPPEFGAPGIDLDVGWLGGGTLSVTGNSFAAPHITGLAAKILSKHRGLKPFELKAILRATAKNAR